MKHLYRTIVLCLFTAPLFAAEELPILWLEAGKTVEQQWIHIGPEQDWSLRFEHRTLSSGKLVTMAEAQAIGHRWMKITTPPLKPGIRLHAKLFFGNVEAVKVVIASPEPFEDRDVWFEKYPFVLYEPAYLSRFDRSSDALKNAGFPYKTIGSYAEIESHENGMIVIAEKISFEQERGLMELLQKKVAEGFSVLVIAPEDDVPIDFDPAISSLSFHADRRSILPDCSVFGHGGAWAMRAKNNGIVLSSELILPINMKQGKIGTVGPKILDVRFSFSERQTPLHPLKEYENGRFYFDKDPVFGFMRTHVVTRYYFKALIEKLSNKGENE